MSEPRSHRPRIELVTPTAPAWTAIGPHHVLSVALLQLAHLEIIPSSWLIIRRRSTTSRRTCDILDPRRAKRLACGVGNTGHVGSNCNRHTDHPRCRRAVGSAVVRRLLSPI